MKKTLRTTIIVLIAIMTLALSTVAASAANTTITKFNLSKTSATITQGQSLSLGISYAYAGAKPDSSTIKWTTSNSSVATVKGGIVRGNTKAGTATITAKFGDKTATCKVTVKATDIANAYTELNKYRKNAKLKALKKDANLEKLAKIRAEEMAKTGKFSHTRPNGKSSLTLITGNKAKGENIAMGQTTAAEVTKAWYNSKGHRDNMLSGTTASKKFTKVGIACYTYNGVTYWCQLFSN